MSTIGIPREIKNSEHRVAITPDGVAELIHHGARVVVEAGAGDDIGVGDDDFSAAGASIDPDAARVWERSDLVCKVKEPQPSEFAYLRPGLVLFTFLHLAAYPDVAHALIKSGTTAIAYETVRAPDGSLPLLAPMSGIAGRMATQIGAHLLERPSGGRGVLLGGAPGVRPGRVAVIGAGNVGWNAAEVALGMGAEVALLDSDLERLRQIDQIGHGRLSTLASNRAVVDREVRSADLVIGAVLIAGARAPIVVTAQTVSSMQARSVIVDVAVDQGGCVETTRETTHDAPTYRVSDVVHYAVGNIPGAVPRTSTLALTNATLRHMVDLATAPSMSEAFRREPLAAGVNVHDGEVAHPAVAAALGLTARPLDELRG